MTTLLVRQAVVADLRAVADLFDRFRQFQGQPPAREACLAFLRERFDHGESVVFLATLDDRPAGFAQLYPSFSSTALARVYILNDLYVAADARRSGAASALLAAVEQHAWAFGACRVSLNVLQSNVDAQALYRARGWVQDNEFFMFHRRPDPGGHDGADRAP